MTRNDPEALLLCAAVCCLMAVPEGQLSLKEAEEEIEALGLSDKQLILVRRAASMMNNDLEAGKLGHASLDYLNLATQHLH